MLVPSLKYIDEKVDFRVILNMDVPTRAGSDFCLKRIRIRQEKLNPGPIIKYNLSIKVNIFVMLMLWSKHIARKVRF